MHGAVLRRRSAAERTVRALVLAGAVSLSAAAAAQQAASAIASTSNATPAVPPAEITF